LNCSVWTVRIHLAID
jgi:hypothetical protein